MSREMRRKKQLLSPADVDAVMNRCTNGVLSCSGDDGYPYGVPVSFVYTQGRIYFHTTAEGHKMDAMRKDPKVSFCVVDEDTIVSAEYTTYFRSVIVFGKARKTEGEEWESAFAALVNKYCSDQDPEANAKEIDGCTQAVIMAIDVDHITGKEAIEYVRAKAASMKQ